MQKFRLFVAVALSLVIGQNLFAQTQGTNRDIQFRSIDLTNQLLELHNFGTSTLSIENWRFCTHDETVGRQYSNGFGNISLGAGDSYVIDWSNSGLGDININDVGGDFIPDLIADSSGEGVALEIYTTAPFSTGANMVDHIQYSFGATTPPTGDFPRNSLAASENLWTDAGDWVRTGVSSTTITMTGNAFPGGTGAHGPLSYTVATVPEPATATLLTFATLTVVARRRRR